MTYFETFCKAARDYNEALYEYYKKDKPGYTKAIDYYYAKIDGMCELAKAEGNLLIFHSNSACYITDCESIIGNARCKAKIDNAKSVECLLNFFGR